MIQNAGAASVKYTHRSDSLHPLSCSAGCIVPCIIVHQISHNKYQLLIQRLVLFFYPMVAQNPLAARALPDIFPKRYSETVIILITQTGAESKIALRACAFYPTPVKMAYS